jgi:hypothetical protein
MSVWLMMLLMQSLLKWKSDRAKKKGKSDYQIGSNSLDDVVFNETE